jgi:ribonuclease P protein component
LEADGKRSKVIIPSAGVHEKLPRRSILRGRKNFAHLFRHGKRIEGSLMSCSTAILPDSSGVKLSFAVSVQRRVGPAVLRNKIKRWVREAYRRNKKVLTDLAERSDSPTAVLFSYRRHDIDKKISYTDIERDVKYILGKIIQMKDRQ